jgi:hypothetical protein
VDADTGNCLTIPDTACTGTDVLAWTDDANGDATTGDYGWSCQSNSLLSGSLETLSDTYTDNCKVGQVLTWTTTDDGGTSLDFTDDTNEWTCEDASVVISGDSLYTGKVAGSTSVGSYVSANSLCGAEKKICTFEDILFSIRSGESLPTEQLWITNGPPGDFVGVNDCAGFTSSGSSYYGSVWVGDLSRPAIRPCNSPTNFACCNK